MFKTKKGFTLIEFLVAVVIMMVGLLGLLQAVNVALFHNMNNQIRNEAVVVADSFMAKEMAKPFDLISTTDGYFTEKRNLAAAFKQYSVHRSGSTLSNSKQVTITVSWRSKGSRYEHSATSVISKTY